MTVSTAAKARDAEAVQAGPSNELVIERLARLAPRPTSLARTGLSPPFLADLLSKHLLSCGVLTTSQILGRMALSGPICDQIINLLRAEGRLEIRARHANEGELRYGLTDRGRADALEAMRRSGYVGPTPVPIEDYALLVTRQSVHAQRVSREKVRAAFDGIAVSEALVDRLGPALNSRRAIFLYGHAGTGKTFTARRLSQAIDGLVLVPHAIAVNESVIEILDPLVHQQLEFVDPPSSTLLDHGFDPRYAACERPIVLTGGELTADMLEVQFDSVRRTQTAPIQLKANNGFLLIDDLGRQRVPPSVLLNRWIVPMESHHDSLTVGTGHHFDVPFDVVLVFSTNLTPHDVADEAFLRRLGYKIEFKPASVEQYRAIWYGVCRDRKLDVDPSLVDFAVRELHGRHGIPLLPCHPRDLLSMACDRRDYLGLDKIDETTLTWAWHSYFVTGTADS